MKTYTVEVLDNGTKCWYLNGALHREDGPAVEYANGTKKWYLNGKLHRVDGPAIEFGSNDKFWYPNSELGISDIRGGAILIRKWYLNGKLHREDGPAVEFDCGSGHWYLHGEKLTEEEFLSRTAKTIVIDGIKYKLVK